MVGTLNVVSLSAHSRCFITIDFMKSAARHSSNPCDVSIRLFVQLNYHHFKTPQDRNTMKRLEGVRIIWGMNECLNDECYLKTLFSLVLQRISSGKTFKMPRRRNTPDVL